MLNKSTLILIAPLIIFLGCSSYPDSAQELATTVCEDVKVANIDDIEGYILSEDVKKFQNKKAHFKERLESKKFIAKRQRLDCATVVSTENYDANHTEITFNEMQINLYKVQNQWKFAL